MNVCSAGRACLQQRTDFVTSPQRAARTKTSDDGLSAVSKALVAICRTMPYVQCASSRGVNRFRTLQQPVTLQFFR
jgi:hypothetical protein